METKRFAAFMKSHWFAAICSMLSLLWLSFVLYLDLQYDKFPAVVVGGIKILLAVYVVMGLCYLLWRGVAMLLRRGLAIMKVR